MAQTHPGMQCATSLQVDFVSNICCQYAAVELPMLERDHEHEHASGPPHLFTLRGSDDCCPSEAQVLRRATRTLWQPLLGQEGTALPSMTFLSSWKHEHKGLSWLELRHTRRLLTAGLHDPRMTSAACLAPWNAARCRRARAIRLLPPRLRHRACPRMPTTGTTMATLLICQRIKTGEPASRTVSVPSHDRTGK